MNAKTVQKWKAKIVFFDNYTKLNTVFGFCKMLTAE